MSTLKAKRVYSQTLLNCFSFFFFFFLCYLSLTAQTIQTLIKGSATDSSFYHLAKISPNEFWAGGKYGVLNRIDSSGTISHVVYPNEGLHILKIQRVNNFVFVATDDAVIYRYDLNTGLVLKGFFPKFKNKCFYDFIPLQNGNLLVCGGTSGIAKGEKKIPRGFIALVDQDLKEMKMVWRCYRKFVWSLLESKENVVLAATYNGFNSRIIRTELRKKQFHTTSSENYSSNKLKWKTAFRVKKLVHEIASFDSTVLYCGTEKTNYTLDGIFGTKSGQQLVVKGSGCLWSMDELKENIISVSNSGSLYFFDMKTNRINQINMPSPFALYDIEKISDSKILLVGSGKCAYLITLP